jgi:predicted flap endonuclease-1-like 5' DNA nuclease
MTQQSPLSPGAGSTSTGSTPGQTQTGKRGVAAAGPKVLRIGLIQGGRVIEERIVKQRTSVSVGASEKNMFVIPGGDLPPQFRLFELIGSGYCLNFTAGMQGRVTLPGGSSDLNELRAQARSAGHSAHQIELTDDCRGKLVIGDTTFLFQFVAPPALQPRPQLPGSVTRGAAAADLPTTVIAAVSFLIHFCAIGAIYSDWLDPVIDYDVNVSALVETVKALPAPPPVEEPAEVTPEEQDPSKAPKADTPKPVQKAFQSSAGAKEHLTKSQAAALSNELQSLEMATLAALAGIGPATASVLQTGEISTQALDAAAASEAGVSSGPGGLKLGGSGGTLRPGAVGGGLASIGTASKAAGTGSGATAVVTGPRGSASVGDAAVAGGTVSDASRVVAQMRAGFRACYNRGLAENPDIEGKIALSIRVGPTGQVVGVTATKTGNIPDSVIECVKSRATSASFAAPQGGAAVVQVPVSFVKQ